MATKLLLVRHGETESNKEGRLQGQSDSNLTDLGSSQARLLGKRLATWEIAACYSSDLGRTLRTAEYVVAQLELPIQKDARLREQHFGDFQGKTFSEIADVAEGDFQQYAAAVRGIGGADVKFPGGETQQMVFERSLEAVEEIAKAHPGDTVLVVCHGVVLTVLLKHFLGLPITAPRRFAIPNTALNMAERSADGDWEVQTLADTSHYEDHARSHL